MVSRIYSEFQICTTVTQIPHYFTDLRPGLVLGDGLLGVGQCFFLVLKVRLSKSRLVSKNGLKSLFFALAEQFPLKV